ncbi:MAG: sigma-70 family RNA polymerase sigma factor [Actinomycetota bacterium]
MDDRGSISSTGGSLPDAGPPDEALVAAALAGDRDAVAAIYDRYADRLHDFCYSVLRDRDEAADAVHDTFLHAIPRLGQLRDPARLRPWLYAIARNQALSVVRARKRFEPVEEVPEVSAGGSGSDPETSAEHAELRRLVWDAAAGLAPRDRMVLDLHLRQGLEGEELAEAAGMSTPQAYVALSRLRDQVERALGAFLIARLGRHDCPDLEGILAGWDGAFSPLVRKRVARHVDGCEICGPRRRRLVSPLGLLSAIPLVPAPAALRERVLESLRLTGAVSVPVPSGDVTPDAPTPTASGPPAGAHGAAPAGLPPAGTDPGSATQRRTRAALLIGIAAVLALLAGSLWAWQQAPNEDPTNASPAGGSSPPGVPVPAGAASELPLEPPDPGSPAPARGATGPGAGASLAPAPSPQSITSPSAAPDLAGPAISGVAATPLRIWESDRRGTCAGAPGQATTLVVEASIDDPAGVASAEVRWSVGATTGSVPLVRTRSGSWEATVGPFGTGTVPTGQGLATMTLEVRATDRAGNAARAAGPEARVVDCPSSAAP